MPGESAQREYETLRDNRRSFIRDRLWVLLALTVGLGVFLGTLAHVYLDSWWLGAFFAVILAASKLVPTQREKAFARGAEGERIVGAALDALTRDSVVVLHDRLIPRSRANIDHIMVTPAAVWTIDAKRYSGRVETRARGTELWVDGRNRSKLLDQSDQQVEVVRGVLERAGFANVPVRGALCFTGVEWPWLFPLNEVRGVRVTSSKGLSRIADDCATDRVIDVHTVAEVLADALRPAVHEEPASGEQATPATPRQHGLKPAQSQEHLDYFATSRGRGERTSAPACRCGAPMERRARRRDGQPFWGCSTFPSCRHTRSIEAADG